MSVMSLLIMFAVASAVGAIGLAGGLLVNPRIGRWAERMTEDDDGE